MSTTSQKLNALESVGLVRLAQMEPDLEYLFQHALMQDAAYQSLLLSDRRQYHKTIGETIEQLYPERLGEFSSVLARHFSLAGNVKRALTYSLQAGESAANLYANAEALAHYNQALDILRQETVAIGAEQALQAFQQRGRVLEISGDYPAAVKNYEEMRDYGRLQNNVAIEGMAIGNLAACYTIPNELHDRAFTLKYIEQGLTFARQTKDPDLEIKLLLSKIMLATHYGDAKDILVTGDAGIALAREHGLTQQLAHILHDLAISLRLNGYVEKGNRYAAEARQIFRKTENLPMLTDSLNQKAFIDFYDAQFASAVEYATEAKEISEQIYNQWNMAYAGMIQGMVYNIRGQWGEAHAVWQQAVIDGQSVGFLIPSSFVSLEIGRLHRTVGDFQTAYDLHLYALDVSQEHAPFFMKAARSELAMDAFALGNIEEGIKWNNQAQCSQSLGAIGNSMTLPSPSQSMIETAYHTGAWEAALQSVLQAQEEAKSRCLPVYLALLMYEQGRCLGNMQRYQEAEASFQKAIELANSRSIRSVLWQAYLALGQLYQFTNKSQKATEHLQLSNQFVKEIGQTLPMPNQRNRFLQTVSKLVLVKNQ